MDHWERTVRNIRQFAASGVLAAGMIYALLPVAPLRSVHGQESEVELSYVDRTLLIEYQLLRRENVPLVIAAEPKRMAEVLRGIGESGAKVISHQDDIGYVYVLAPYKSVENLTKLAGIDAMQVDCYNECDAVAVADIEKQTKTAAPPDPFLQSDNPFTGESATEASTFKTSHPTFDGRGVTAAFVEPADPMLPSMKGALDLNGAPLGKFEKYSWGDATDAVGADAVAEGTYWQHTASVIPDKQGRISFAGRQYILPPNISAREWRICVRRPGGWDNQETSVLWAVDADRVWMLRGGKQDFSEAPNAEVEEPFFAVITHTYKHDTDDSRLWVFNVDEPERLLAFARTRTSHASMVASVLAGDSFLGSQAGGVAPAARLAVFSGGQQVTMPSRTTAESTFAAFHDSSVDVVSSSAFINDGARPASSSAYELFADRLIRLTGKPFAKAIGNFGPLIGGVTEFNLSGEVLSIGGFVPQETWRANEGFEPSSDSTLAEYSGWGPADDGGLKPDFLALTQTLCESSYKDAAYEEPYGLYTMSAGTSAAAPNAAGHLALLVSAAKQSGVKYDVPRLRAAIATTAKFLPEVPARAQGYGLIQVADAWEALRRASSWDPPTIVATAPVVGAQEARPAEQHTGRGLLEMSGWVPGASGDREVSVTRINGPSVPLTYRLRWKESDPVAAFSSSVGEISLRLNQPVKIPVHIHVGEAGCYSAVLDLIDSRANLVAHSILTTVFVGQPLTAENGFSTTLKRTLERPGNSVVWIHVPDGLSALHLHVRRADGNDRGALLVQDPAGRSLPYYLDGSSQGDVSQGKFLKGEAFETFTNPVSGLWQFCLREPGTELKASAERLKSTEVTWEITGTRVVFKQETSANHASKSTVVFTNTGSAALEAKIIGMGIGSAELKEVFLEPGLDAPTFEVEVSAGATRIEVSIEQQDPDATVGLYVYNLPEGPGGEVGDTSRGLRNQTALLYRDVSQRPLKRWVLESPKPGRYVVALDPLKVAVGGVKIRYRDVVYHSVFGTVTCDDNDGVVAPGASKSGTVRWQIAAKPADGRSLVAEVGLIDKTRGFSKIVNTGAGLDRGEKLEIVPVPLATQTLDIDR